jgi:hypothetical protein
MPDETILPTKPTIAEILIEFGETDQPEMDMLMRIKEHHPKATKEEFEAAMAAAMQAMGGPKLQEAAKPTVSVIDVVDRIVLQTFDAAVESGEKPHVRSLIKVAAGVIDQHPARDVILPWLAQEKLEGLFDSRFRTRHRPGLGLQLALGRSHPGGSRLRTSGGLNDARPG